MEQPRPMRPARPMEQPRPMRTARPVEPHRPMRQVFHAGQIFKFSYQLKPQKIGLPDPRKPRDPWLDESFNIFPKPDAYSQPLHDGNSITAIFMRQEGNKMVNKLCRIKKDCCLGVRMLLSFLKIQDEFESETRVGIATLKYYNIHINENMLVTFTPKINYRQHRYCRHPETTGYGTARR